MDKKYLKRQSSGLWLYRRKTPVLLKDKYKSSYIQHSLNTHSYHEAILKRNAINAEIDMQLAHAKRGSNDKALFFHYYAKWRKEYEEREAELTKEDLYNPMEDAEPALLVDKREDAKSPAVKAAWSAMKTGKVPEQYQPTVSELAEEWADWAKDKKNAKYVASMATYIKALVSFMGRDDLPSNLSSGQAQRFIDGLLDSGKSSNTVIHYKSKLQELWRWALTREKATGDNPWLNTRVEASKKKTKPQHYRNFTDEELHKILSSTEYDKLNSKTWAYPYALHVLPILLPFLGTRLSELALAKTEQFVDVSGRMFFEVREGKTVNAQRIVPVCPAIRPLVDEVIAKAGGSEWLFPEIGNAKIGASEAVNSISSKFGKLTKGFTKVEGYKTGLHSFRGHFATALQETGCPVEIATKLAGHKELSLTYSLYSKYENKDELWYWVEKIQETGCLKVLVPRLY
jgi:integrase